MVFVGAAQAAEKPKFVLGTAPIGECTLCYYARDKGYFERAGIDFELVKTETTDVSGMLTSGRFNGHTYTSSGIAAMEQDRVCTKMVLPLIRFAQAIVGVVPKDVLENENRARADGKPLPPSAIEEGRLRSLEGKKLLTFRVPSATASVVEQILASAGVKAELVPIGKFTAERVKRMIAGEGAATHASNPHVTYLKGVRDIQIIVPLGSQRAPEAILAGLYVPCEALSPSPEKRNTIAMVVDVLSRAAADMRDLKNKKEVVQWLVDTWLTREAQASLGTTLEGLPVRSVKDASQPLLVEEAAELLYADIVQSMYAEWPSKAVRDSTVELTLGRKSIKNPDDFFDLSVLGK